MDELIADLEQVAPLLGMVSAAPDLGNLMAPARTAAADGDEPASCFLRPAALGCI